MTWRARWQWFVEGITKAMHDAHREDDCIDQGFARRVGELCEQQRPAIAAAAAAAPLPVPNHDQPSGQTVRVGAVKPPLQSIGGVPNARELRAAAR